MRIDNKLGMDVVSIFWGIQIVLLFFDFICIVAGIAIMFCCAIDWFISVNMIFFYSTAFVKVLLDSYLEAGNFLHLPPVILQHSCA